MGQDTIEAHGALRTPDDVHEAILAMVEHPDRIIHAISDIEPMMGGWTARIRSDGAIEESHELDGFVVDEQALRTMHGTHRAAASGRCARGGIVLAWQGEVERPEGGFESGTFQIWIGCADSPPADVAYAFGREHDRLVGEAILERMSEDAVHLNAADPEAVMSTPHAHERLAEIRRVLSMLDQSIGN